MSIRTRVKNLEGKLSANTNKELIGLLRRMKADNGDTSPTLDNLDVAECLRQIADFLPA